ncbi:MAG TPA: hypothetical protein VIO37_10530 [Candidatus Dormibacteraeota bacterium]|jgi:hypothetical protein
MSTERTFWVAVREVHIQQVAIDATSPEEAIAKVRDGQGAYLDNAIEYSHCLDPETWTVEEQ